MTRINVTAAETQKSASSQQAPEVEAAKGASLSEFSELYLSPETKDGEDLEKSDKLRAEIATLEVVIATALSPESEGATMATEFRQMLEDVRDPFADLQEQLSRLQSLRNQARAAITQADALGLPAKEVGTLATGIADLTARIAEVEDDIAQLKEQLFGTEAAGKVQKNKRRA